MSPPALEIHQKAQFEADGYVVIPGLLDWNLDIQPVIDEYTQLLDRLAQQWKSQGKLASTHTRLPFFERLMRTVIESEMPYDLHFDISLPKSGVTEDTPMHHGPAVFELLRSPRLLDVVEQFVGPEIYSNPVQHVRMKLPEHRLPKASYTGLTARSPWHQDLGVVTQDADETEMLTVWIPITPATVENGCLLIAPGSHRDGLARHCPSRDVATRDQLCVPEPLVGEYQCPVPMQPGDVLFMHKMTQHCSLVNRSEHVRWSFDLRYHPIEQPTGRKWFPGFIARSRKRPEQELRSAEQWASLWRAARRRLANADNPCFDRWIADDPQCA